MASLRELDKKIDKVIDVQMQQAATLGRLTASVEEHVERSNKQDDRQEKVEAQVEGIKKHVNMVQGAGMLIGLAASIATIVEVIHLFFRG